MLELDPIKKNLATHIPGDNYLGVLCLNNNTEWQPMLHKIPILKNKFESSDFYCFIMQASNHFSSVILYKKKLYIIDSLNSSHGSPDILNCLKHNTFQIKDGEELTDISLRNVYYIKLETQQSGDTCGAHVAAFLYFFFRVENRITLLDRLTYLSLPEGNKLKYLNEAFFDRHVNDKDNLVMHVENPQGLSSDYLFSDITVEDQNFLLASFSEDFSIYQSLLSGTENLYQNKSQISKLSITLYGDINNDKTIKYMQTAYKEYFDISEADIILEDNADDIINNNIKIFNGKEEESLNTLYPNISIETNLLTNNAVTNNLSNNLDNNINTNINNTGNNNNTNNGNNSENNMTCTWKTGVIIGVVAVILVGGGYGAYYFMQKNNNEDYSYDEF